MDTMQRRMSAMNPASPWRGPMVEATTAGFTESNRRGALWLYGLSTIPPVNGPLMCHAATIYRPGAQIGQNWKPGAMAGDAYLPGGVDGGVYLPGARRGDGYRPGMQEGMGE